MKRNHKNVAKNVNLIIGLHIFFSLYLFSLFLLKLTSFFFFLISTFIF